MGDAEARMPDAYDEEMDAIYAHEVDVWIDEHEKVNGKVPQKSNTRIIICENLATMSKYRLLHGDNTVFVVVEREHQLVNSEHLSIPLRPAALLQHSPCE